MAEYADRYWSSRDGLRLHYRDYPAVDGAGGRAPVICVPGLTRNGRDFEGLAEAIAGPRRVLCVDLRGRGHSEHPRDPGSYSPMQYADDLAALFEQTDIASAVMIGTSLGGLITMLAALSAPQRIVGAVLNDIGPVVEQAGLTRIRGYIGQARSFPTWMHAARAMEEVHGHCYPDWGVNDWLIFAKRQMALGSNGRVQFDYDMRIADAFSDHEPAPEHDTVAAAPADLWPGFDALAGRPVLVIRGKASDILSDAVAREMAGRIPDVELVTVARTGHAPTLDEPEARAAIARLLDRAA